MTTIGAKETIEAAAKFWEDFTLTATVLSAVFTSASAFLAIFEKRRVWFQRAGQIVSLFAAVFAIAGAASLIIFTSKNRALQRIDATEKSDLQNRLTITAGQAANAVADANNAVLSLKQAKEQVSNLTRDQTDLANHLNAAYGQLAQTKLQLRSVEQDLQPRTINAAQRHQMMRILTQLASGPHPHPRIDFYPMVGDPESHSFASQLRSVFSDSGWSTGFLPILEFGVSEQARPPEGITLEMRLAEEDVELRDGLISALRVVSSVVIVDYNETRSRNVVGIVVGKKPARAARR